MANVPPPEHPLEFNEQGEVVGQLPMFMTANEIRQSHQALHGDYVGNETERALFKRKLGEAKAVPPTKKKSLAQHIQEEGVKAPVQLGVNPAPAYTYGHQDTKPEILGGHHRVAVSEEHDPHRLMPVLFYDKAEVEDAPHDFYAARTEPAYPYDDRRTDAEIRENWRQAQTPQVGRISRAMRQRGFSSDVFPGASSLIRGLASASSSLITTMTRTNTPEGGKGAFGPLISISKMAMTSSPKTKLPPPPPERPLV